MKSLLVLINLSNGEQYILPQSGAHFTSIYCVLIRATYGLLMNLGALTLAFINS